MSIFGRFEETLSKRFYYSMGDVRSKYLKILQEDMDCSSLQQLATNEFKLDTPLSFKYNMYPGTVEITFSDTGNSILIKTHVYLNLKSVARLEDWINKGYELLEAALKECKPYIEDKPTDGNEVFRKRIKCPVCTKSFTLEEKVDTFYCMYCGQKLHL